LSEKLQKNLQKWAFPPIFGSFLKAFKQKSSPVNSKRCNKLEKAERIRKAPKSSKILRETLKKLPKVGISAYFWEFFRKFSSSINYKLAKIRKAS
jgi:hypothetical protein